MVKYNLLILLEGALFITKQWKQRFIVAKHLQLKKRVYYDKTTFDLKVSLF